ncbi:hypothetical protein [Vibrio fluvialis]|uniref:hypothetical protein n=1 Tax=Vibrio fluvialis TaxID=676 RepID=UPI00192A77E6|nr:hypothetical protein [Vibrio fluvialis]MBL4283778.1 hypothetical protein [Vibrio fluvialis]MDT8868041.1 hypothetical protein [Vibrio fluvialis]MDT8875400.1 hypothetical protein [Vibrio fluvialis]
MEKFRIDGLDIEVGNKVYTTRYVLIVITLLFLLIITNSSHSGYLQLTITLPLTLLLLLEIRRLVYKPTLLVIGYDGIYHFKKGFISWGNIEHVEYYVNERNMLEKSLKVHVREGETWINYWFLKPINMSNNILNLSMSYTDCNVKKASQHAKVMKTWYEAYRRNIG